jgi:hypothetical protein
VADQIEPLPPGEDSPWAHDVPIQPPAPLPAAWTSLVVDHSVVAGDGLMRANTRASQAGGPGDQLLDPPRPVDAAGTPLTNRKRSVLVAGVFGLAAAIAIGSQVIGGGSADSNGSAARAGVNEGATFDSQVWFPDTEPAPSSTAGSRQPAATTATLPEPEPQWVTTQVELSARLQQMTAPTEVIALAEGGTLISISIPSGEVHSIDTQGFSSDAGLVLGTQAIVLQAFGPGASKLARVDQPLLPIDVPSGVSYLLAQPGTDGFVVFSNQVSPSSAATPFLLADDGTLTEIVDGPFVDSDVGALGYLPGGELIVYDTGGLYFFDDGGASQLLTTGDLVGIGVNHYVLRECDDQRNCVYVRVDAATGDRSAIVLDSAIDYVNASLSSDGSAMSYVEYGDDGPLQRLVDLGTGAVVELDTARASDYYYFGRGASAWAADGSGVFAINNTQVTFFDRVTGKATAVAPNLDLGDIVAVAARPLSPPVAP